MLIPRSGTSLKHRSFEAPYITMITWGHGAQASGMGWNGDRGAADVSRLLVLQQQQPQSLESPFQKAREQVGRQYSVMRNPASADSCHHLQLARVRETQRKGGGMDGGRTGGDRNG